ncbi:MAG: transporter substrate-binding domain-containing protein [Deltaproteobacteria bacterium]|nr:transporter substrate-binding domain-containing protein [Deltaproteobacteria bacterium]MBW2154502.1 transporter substrate-binding domain-containing protein [Deltaproteobacteria bacterium]
MYIDVSKSHGKYTRVLLRENYREKGKVKHRTVANLTRCSPKEIEAIRLALRHKDQLSQLAKLIDSHFSESLDLKRILTRILSQKTTLETVKERGVLRVGVKENVPNFGFRDHKGNHVGFDVDISLEIAKRLGVELKIVKVTNATSIPMLQKYRVDCIAAAMTHYRKRDAIIDFSIGYFYTPQTAMVKKETRIASIKDLNEKKVGASRGAGAIDNFLKVQPAGIVNEFKNYKSAFIALQKDKIDALIADFILLKGLLAVCPYPEDYVILPKENFFGGGYYAIAIRENDSNWRSAINESLQDIWIDGTWDRIFDKWFGPATPYNLSKKELGFQMVITR